MLLLTIIYISFIGLGLPDSMFGTAWPAIYQEWGLPFSFGSFIVSIIYCGTMISSLLSAKVINRFGTNKVSAFSTALTAAAMAGFSISENYWMLCLFAVPLGIGAGAIDTALNNYVALHYTSRHMSFLHCFYGIGIVASPYVLAMVMHGDGGWRNGYRIVFLIQTVIAIILFAALPLWGKKRGTEAKEEWVKDIPLKQVVKIRGVKLTCGLFIAACAIESVCGSFGSTYLVEQRGLEADTAARIIIFYYVGLALGRLASGLAAEKLHSWNIVRIGQCILGIGILAMILPGTIQLAAAGFFLIGFGNGPQFPNFNYLTPIIFGEDASPSIMGVQMAVSSLSSMATPVLCGFLSQQIGMWIFPFYLLIFFIGMIAAVLRANKVLWATELSSK